MRSHRLCFTIAICISLISAAISAQFDVNGPNAELRLQGFVPSAVDPVDHDVLVATPGMFELSIGSGANAEQGIILLGSLVDPSSGSVFPTPWGGSLDVGSPGASIPIQIFLVADGVGGLGNPLLDSFFVTDAAGALSMAVSAGVSQLGTRVALQAIVEDPTDGPFFLDNTEAGDATLAAPPLPSLSIDLDADAVMSLDVDNSVSAALTSAEASALFALAQASPGYGLLKAAILTATGAPDLDTALVAGNSLLIPPLAPAVSPLELEMVLVPVQAPAPAPAAATAMGFSSGLTYGRDLTTGRESLFAVLLESTGPGQVEVRVLYFDGFDVRYVALNSADLGAPSLIQPVEIDGQAGAVVFSPSSSIPSIPLKYRKANGEFVGAARATCLFVVCLLQDVGCGLAGVLACLKVPALLAPLLSVCPLCPAIAAVVCGVLVATICELGLGSLGASPQQVCDMLGYPEYCPPSSGSSSYALPDDGNIEHVLTVPVTFYGTVYSSIFISSNGYVTFGSGSEDFSPTMPEFFDGWGAAPNPGVAVLYSDLNRVGEFSGATYDVVEDQVNGTVSVSFTNQVWWSTGDPAGTSICTFGALGPGSVELDHTSTIGPTSPIDAIIGVTDGDGTFGSDTDQSNLAGTGILGSLGTYASSSAPDSVGELVPAHIAFPFPAPITYLGFGAGGWAIF